MCVVVPRASWQGRPLRSPVASLWPWRGNRHRAFPHQWGDFRSPQTPSTLHPVVCSGKAEGACLPLGTQPPPARQGSVPAPLDPMTISSRPTLRGLDARQGLGDLPLHPAPEPCSNRLLAPIRHGKPITDLRSGSRPTGCRPSGRAWPRSTGRSTGATSP